MGAVLILGYLPISLIVGCAAFDLASMFRRKRRESAVAGMTVILLLLALIFSYVRANDISLGQHFLTKADVAAMSWIKANTPPKAIFAINTYFDQPHRPYGIDGGYWIPYFTGRRTTASCMLFNLGQESSLVLDMSHAAVRLGNDNGALEELRKFGVNYIYIGQRGPYIREAQLSPERLSQSPDVTNIYNQDGVYIYAIR